jgi:NADP-dependent 3-hydroxy acid dehydrogenase YdfG
VHSLNVDVSDKKAMFDAINSLPVDFSQTDILVNNAGAALGVSPLRYKYILNLNPPINPNSNPNPNYQ